MIRRLIVLLLIGLSVAAIVGWGVTRYPVPVAVTKIAASDWLLVRTGGPRLAAAACRDDIVLVLLDERSAIQLGDIRSMAHDLAVYQTLLDAGARCVYDTRSVAAADQATLDEWLPLLLSMAALRSDGSLMRNAQLKLDLLSPDQATALAPLLVANPLSGPSHAMPLLRSRICPLHSFTVAGMQEAAALQLARRAWQVPSLTADQTLEQMTDSGVIAAWHQQAPEVAPPSDVARTAYPLGPADVPWYVFPSASILVPPSGFWIDYGPAVDGYQTLAYVDVLEGLQPLDLADKLVLVGFGADVALAADQFSVPSVQRGAAEAEVLAAAVQTLLDRRWMQDPPRWLQIVGLGVVCLTLAVLGGMLRPLVALAAVPVGLLVYGIVAYAGYRSGWFTDFAIIPAAGGLSGVLGLAYGSWLSVRARHRIVDLFGRYVPRAVVHQMMQQGDLKALTLGGSKRDVTVMFADIRGFTTFSEHLPPEEVVSQLNSLLEVMVECTFANEGTLDKYIGDAILVLFNAPLEQPDHVQRAIRTALAIQQRLAGHPTGLSVGIGLHCGEAVVGNIGTWQRLEYTAIGNTVNIASRLCSVARPGEIIVSEAIVSGLAGEGNFEPLQPVSVKGIQQPLICYRAE